MNKTKIEWVKNPDGSQGYTWNPITGCLNGCEYCYAKKLANTRLKEIYLANKDVAPYKGEVDYMKNRQDPFYPRFWEDRLDEPIRGYHKADWLGVTPDAASEKGIFVCDMSDLFGIRIPHEWTQKVMDTIKKCPHDRFYLLTKQPQNLIKFSPFPQNCFVGVTATDHNMAYKAVECLREIEAKVKYISFEPLLGQITKWVGDKEYLFKYLDWVIIGSQTKPTVMPKIEWVTHIVEAADKAGIPMFLKDNLISALPFERAEWAWARDKYFEGRASSMVYTGLLRQEMPE